MLGELRGEGGDRPEYDPDSGASKGDYKEAGGAKRDVEGSDVIHAHFGEGFEELVEDHWDGVVEEGLAEDYDVEHVVDLDLDEGGEDGDGVHGGYECGEDEELEDFEVGAAVNGGEGEEPEGEAGEEDVEDGVADGEEEDGADVVEEGPFGEIGRFERSERNMTF